eukprot:857334-Pyramimonas_sp.AAC.1
MDGAALLDDVVDDDLVVDLDTGCSSSPGSSGVRTLCPSRSRGSDILSHTDLVWACGLRSQNPDGEGSSTSPPQVQGVNCENLSLDGVSTQNPGGGCSSSPPTQVHRVNCEHDWMRSCERIAPCGTIAGTSSVEPSR